MTPTRFVGFALASFSVGCAFLAMLLADERSALLADPKAVSVDAWAFWLGAPVGSALLATGLFAAACGLLLGQRAAPGLATGAERARFRREVGPAMERS